MYVWEVRENGGYDGILWSTLIRCYKNSLGKVKKTVLDDLKLSCGYDSIATAQIPIVENLNTLEDFMSFDKRGSTIEVIKTDVL